MTTLFKFAITGTHSTGKSTFLDALEARLGARGLRVGRIGSLAVRARELGFPILTEHSIESSLWIMAEGLRLEAELSLSCDIILVDRPPLDALAYLKAGLSISGRSLPADRMTRLHSLARLSIEDYDKVVMTVLDPIVAIGAGRDQHVGLRSEADRYIAELVAEMAPRALRLTHGEAPEVLTAVEQAILDARPA